MFINKNKEAESVKHNSNDNLEKNIPVSGIFKLNTKTISFDMLVINSDDTSISRRFWDDNYENPPKSKDGPPVAASIAWAQSLYRRAKRPIMRFKTMETSGSAWGNTKEIYLNIARKIDQYIQAKYSSWHDTVSDIAMKWLAKPVFGPTIRPSEAKNANIIPKPPYFVNFSPELVALVQEAKALDRMGFPVPESALNIALQEKKFSLFSNLYSHKKKRETLPL